MANIYGGSANSGLQIAEVSSWGGAAVSTYMRIPLVSASETVEIDTIPVPDEISQAGGNPTGAAIASKTASGEFTTKLDCNAYWFWLLMRHSMGAEFVVQNRNLWNTVISNAWTHGFIPQSYRETYYQNVGGKGYGLIAQMLKGGDWDTNALCEVYKGFTITGWTLNQPSDQSPTMTWRWIAKPAELIDIDDPSVTVQSVNQSERKIPTFRSLIVRLEQSGDGTDDLEIQSLNMTFSKPWEFGGQFITTLGSTDIDQPGYVGNHDVTFDLECPLIAATGGGSSYGNNDPLALFNAATSGRLLRVIYAPSGTGWTIPTSAETYKMDLTVPDIVWTAAEAPVAGNDPLIISASGRGRMSWIKRTGSATYRLFSFQSVDGGTRNYKAPILVQVTNGQEETYDYARTSDQPYTSDPHPAITAGTRANLLETLGYWFLDETGGSETNTTQLNNPNNPASGSATETYRLRFLVRAWGACTDIVQKIQSSNDGGVTWDDVTTSSTDVRINTSATGITEGSHCSKIMSGSPFFANNYGVEGGTGADGTACRAADETTPPGIDPVAGDTFECLFALVNQSGVSGTLMFRLVNGSAINRLSAMPLMYIT